MPTLGKKFGIRTNKTLRKVDKTKALERLDEFTTSECIEYQAINHVYEGDKLFVSESHFEVIDKKAQRKMNKLKQDRKNRSCSTESSTSEEDQKAQQSHMKFQDKIYSDKQARELYEKDELHELIKQKKQIPKRGEDEEKNQEIEEMHNDLQKKIDKIKFKAISIEGNLNKFQNTIVHIDPRDVISQKQFHSKFLQKNAVAEEGNEKSILTYKPEKKNKVFNVEKQRINRKKQIMIG